EDALKDFDRALAIAPDYGWAMEMKGRTLYTAGRYREAGEILEKASLLGGWSPDGYSQIVQAMMVIGRRAAALEMAETAMAKFPHSLVLLAVGGEVLRMLGKLPEAVTRLEEAIQHNATDAYPWASKGAAEQAMGRFDDALASLNQALELEPKYTW